MKHPYLIFLFILCQLSVQHKQNNESGDLSTWQSCNPEGTVQYQAGFNDIVVTEVMADPLPSVGMPELEYIEIYNRCPFEICLDKWQICLGNRCAVLQPFNILPGDYVFLFDSKHADLFRGSQKAIPVNEFPAVSNTGQTIILTDSTGNIIFSLEYDDTWYRSSEKRNGGWSLEMIDPGNPCGKEENWKASENVNGGTPGMRNSVYAENPDYKKPELLKAVIISDSSLFLYFNETVSDVNLYQFDTYFVNNGVGTPYRLKTGGNSHNSVVLYFDKLFIGNTYYSLKIKNKLTDCAGNQLQKENYYLFRKPFPCDSLDLVINEIMFDPSVPGGEFLELYNRSFKTIDIEGFAISLKDPYTEKSGPLYPLSEVHYTIEPGKYILLTGNTRLISDIYYIESTYNFLKMKNFPNLPNENRFISLYDAHNRIIDEVLYSPDFHNELIINTKGVSLERVSHEASSTQPHNWLSASGDFDYATPGYENSQYFENDESSSIRVFAEPEIITPDGDGRCDETVIKYSVSDAGYFANIIVFDCTGRPVKKIAQNFPVGRKGEFIWNGKTDYNRKAPVGAYVIYAEIYNMSGDIEKFKICSIIAERIY